MTGLLAEQIQIMAHVTLLMTCREEDDAQTINVNYLIVGTILPYYIILRRSTINALRVVVSTRCLTLYYLIIDSSMGTVRRDQQVTHECYLRSL